MVRRKKMKRMTGKNTLLAVILIAWVVLSTTSLVLAITESPGPGDNRELARSLNVGDPISAGNGAYRYYKPLLRFGGMIPFTFGIYYGSDFCSDCIKGTNPSDLTSEFWWTPKYAAGISLLTIGGTSVDLFSAILGNCDIVSFKKMGADWVLTGPADGSPASPVKYVLKETDNLLWLMDPVKQLVAIFHKLPGGDLRIEYVFDRRSEFQNLHYIYDDLFGMDTSPGAVFTNDSRVLDFTYDLTIFRLSKIEERQADWTLLREISLSYNVSGDLVSVTDPMGNITTLNYASTVRGNKISSISLPKGNTRYQQHYALKNMNGIDEIRVIDQTDAYDNVHTLNYDTAANVVSAQRPDGNTDTYTHYSHHGPPKDLADSKGKTMSFTKNNDEQTTSVTDRMGDTTSFTYHPETGKIASITNTKGQTVTHEFTAQDQTFGIYVDECGCTQNATFTFYNLTRKNYPDGTNEQFTYDSKGRMLTKTDRAGKVRSFTYDSHGRLLTITNPTGGVVTYTYTSFNAVASIKNSETGTTTYEYDNYRRLIKINNPDSTSIQIAYNLNDQVTSITDENAHVYSYTYDVNGNLTKVTDPKGNQTQYAFDLMDRVTQITDRLSKNTAFTYDNMGRTSSFTNPNNIVTSFGYDPRGWRNSVTLGGQTWRTGYDDEGVVSSTTTPLGNTTTFQSDKLGLITGITNPLGQTTTFTRDSMSRVTGITDPLGRTTNYGYDNRGLLAGVTMPVIGTATYTRNDLGLLSGITDLNGNNWGFGFTNMGRLSSITDPLSNKTDYSYDNRARLSTIDYPDTTTQTITYDNAGNVTQSQYTSGLTLRYTYDELGRLLAGNGLALTRDAEGRITSTDNPGTAFGATYDDGGRLKTATYNNGTFTVTYTYDSVTGLLTRVTDNLTNAQADFTFDNDRRLTGITRSNGVNATYTYDNSGRVTRIREGSIIDLQYSLDAAGQVSSVDMTVPLDPSTLLADGTDTFSYDSASQVSTAGYAYDPRGRLTSSPGNAFTWDGTSRLTNINGTALSYNGLGDIITRGNIHYFYNYALGLNPIVAEKDDSTGQFLRYYIWAPGGGLLYMIDAADGNKVYFYHFDRTGSTLALTDASGAVTGSYAYTPYGKILGHTGTSSQPFTFVGRWGVRQDPSTSSGLYHTRARYYDAVTARFISREPIWPNTARPKQINPYQYALGNPISFIDRTGYIPEPSWNRYGHTMVIYSDGQVAVYGGQDGTGEIFSDMYTFDERNTSWLNIEQGASNLAQTGPPALSGRSSSVTLADGTILFSGVDQSGQVVDDLWTFDERIFTWTKMTPKNQGASNLAQTTPTALSGYSSRVILPDGTALFSGVNPFHGPDDTWVFDQKNITWAKITPKRQPYLAQTSPGLPPGWTPGYLFFGNREALKKVKKVWLPRVGKWVTESEEWEWMLEQWSRVEAAGWDVPFSVVDPWEWWQSRD